MAHQYRSVFIAALWMLGALSSFAAMAVAGRELAADGLHTFQILVMRSSIGLLIVVAIMSRKGWNRALTRYPGVHLARNGAHFAGQFAWFYAVGVIPLSTVFAIELTTPLWTAVLAVLVLGERLNTARVMAVVSGLVGVMVILRPGWSVIHPAALGMLGGAIAYGLTHTLTKRLSERDSSLTILFFMMLMQLPMALVPGLYVWQPVTPGAWPCVLVVGVAGLAAHYCLIRALLLADATVVIPMDFMRLPLIAVVGYLIYGETVDRYLIAGSLLILTGLLVNLHRQRREETRAE